MYICPHPESLEHTFIHSDIATAVLSFSVFARKSHTVTVLPTIEAEAFNYFLLVTEEGGIECVQSSVLVDKLGFE